MRLSAATAYAAWTGLFLLLAGCGLPGPPQSPSLELPRAVADLDAVRTGGDVTLHWTNPRANTDSTTIRHAITAEIQRCDSNGADCTVLARVAVTAGSTQQWSGVLPPEEQRGSAAVVSYRLKILNRDGASAGESNAALVATGSAPGNIADLRAAYTADGVRLSWREGDPAASLYRVRRYAAGAAAGAPPDATLELQHAGNSVLDTTAKRDKKYRYGVQPVLRERLSAADSVHYVEIAAAEAGPIEVETKDIFPPEAPVGLQAIAGDDHGVPYIDLSWEPRDETDLAGYLVFRREGDGPPQQLTPQPQAAATFRDSTAVPGAHYEYFVVAVDTSGNRSKPSVNVNASTQTN